MFESFHQAWWNAMTRYQLNTPGVNPHHCHRGSAGFAIAMNRFNAGDYGSAMRWCVLTQLSDAILGNNMGGAYGMLIATLGLPSGTVQQITNIAAQKADQLMLAPANWSEWEATPESMILDVIRGPQFAILQRTTTRYEHEITPSVYEKLRVRAASPAGTGADLEELAAYLVSLLPGYRLRRNMLAVDYAYENDVIAALTPYARPLFSDQPTSILIECKNWKTDKLGSSIVGYFYSRMMLVGCRIGVLISQNGVTSMADQGVPQEERAGRAMIRRLHHETGSVVISLDAQALQRIGTASSVLQVLQEPYEDFVFGPDGG
jgi:hypothetical protein